jgi:hypothetical protein
MASISSAAFAETFQAKLPFLDPLDPQYQYWPIAGRESTAPIVGRRPGLLGVAEERRGSGLLTGPPWSRRV